MKCIAIVLVSLVCYATASAENDEVPQLVASSPTYSLDSTNLLDDYVLDAMDSLDRAYRLHQNDVNERIKSFSGLFNDKHPVDGGWSVAQGCVAIHVPTERYYVSLKVTEDSSAAFDGEIGIRNLGDNATTTSTTTTAKPSNSYIITIYN